MTTKETFLQLGIGDPYHETAEKIDFDELDSFVSMFVTGYVNRRGEEVVAGELLTDSLSQTTIFLTRLVEVGTLQFLSQNSLLSGSEEETKDLAFVVAASINIAMAAELQRRGLDKAGGNIFFDIMSLMGLIERVDIHIANARKDSTYIFSLVSFNLVGLVNGDVVE